jgi:hypothetical protein
MTSLRQLAAHAQEQNQSSVSREPHQFRVKIGPCLFMQIATTITGVRIRAYCTERALNGAGGQRYIYRQRLAGKGKFKQCNGAEWNLTNADAVERGMRIINALAHEYGGGEDRVKISNLVD